MLEEVEVKTSMLLADNWQIKVKLFLVYNYKKKTKEKHFCSSLVFYKKYLIVAILL
jgi:hypothetical protein